jgi:hypothetical protein
MRGFPKLAATMLLLATLTAGCGSQAYKKVAEKSIVDADIPVNLILNPGFEKGVLSPWTALIPDNSKLSLAEAVTHRGRYSLRIDMHRKSRKETLNIAQSIDAQDFDEAARFRLTGWVRARNLSKRIPFAIRLDNADGTYSFFSEDSKKKVVAIPKGDSGWTKLVLEARVTKPLSEITVFPANSSADLKGVFWIDDFSLFPIYQASSKRRYREAAESNEASPDHVR